MPRTSEMMISASLLVLTGFPFYINSIHEEAYGQLPNLFNNDTYFLGNDEEQIEDDSSEITIPEKGVFERIEGNSSTGDD